MIGLLQKVSQASVTVDNEVVAAIGRGLLVLVAVEKDDTSAQAERLAERLLGYRVFPDGEKRMNLSVSDIAGELLLVPQFTLAADTRKGTRASFTPAAAPDRGEQLFEELAAALRRHHPAVLTGRFGAHMMVASVNDGPVTFWLQARPG